MLLQSCRAIVMRTPDCMHLPPIVVLAAWIPLGAYLFRRFPLRIAILANFLLGWGLLPGANYVPSSSYFPYWILPVCVPSHDFITKSTIIGLSSIVGILLFHRRTFLSFRPRLIDAPAVLWCFAPLISSLANHLSFWPGFCGFLYLSLAWLPPYFLGRFCFSSRDSLILVAKALVIAGILYVPICVLEFFTGPQLYAHIYGYQPYQWIGARRYIGYRPVGFMEDGNQLGIWMATSALAATGLWVRRLASAVLRIPVQWAALLLILVTLLCQSVGSIVLLGLLLPLTFFNRRSALHMGAAAALAAFVLLAGLHFVHVASLRSLARDNPFVHSIAVALRSIGRDSLSWRIGRDESQLSTAYRAPVFGFGKWDWWRNGGVRPWDLWLLSFGMFGIPGVAALGCLFAAPVARVLWPSRWHEDPGQLSLALLLIGVILMSALDSLLNAAIILPYLLLVGALSSPVHARYPSLSKGHAVHRI